MTRKINKPSFLDKQASFHSDGKSKPIRYARYRDGCYSVTYEDGATEWTGKEHAPHPLFVLGDEPVEMWELTRA